MRLARHLLLAAAAASMAAAAPAAEPPRVFALTNARIVPAPGKVIERGTVVLRQGLVEAVGREVAIPKDATVVDLEGRSVYPALIDPFVTLSRLSGRKEKPPEEEDEAGPRRRGPPATPTPPPVELLGNAHPLSRVHPEKSALDELRVSPDVRQAFLELGFAVVLAVPDRGIFRGEGAVVSLGEGPLTTAVLAARSGQVVAPETEGKDGGDPYPASKMGVVAVVRQAFLDARWSREAETAYAAQPAGRARPERVRAFAALADAVAGKEAVVFETPDVLALLRAAKIASELGLKARYIGAGDAFRLLDDVRALRPELVLSLAFPPVPAVEDDDEWLDVPLERLRAWDRAPSNPHWLKEAGLSFALTTHGLPELTDFADRVRKARARGLSPEDLLAAFTTVPARMLGLSDRLGEIAPGKIANLAVVAGHLFADKSRVTQTWVDGVRYEAKPKKKPPEGAFRVEGFRVEIRNDPKTGALTVSITPPSGGKTVPASSVERHGALVRFEVDGAALGLPPGPVVAEASLEGETLRLDLARGEERSVKQGEREMRPEEGRTVAEAGSAPEKLDVPDSDVRPAPARFATPLAAPRAVLVKNATIWTSGPAGTLPKANLLVVDGKVAALGPDTKVPAALAASVLEIDGTGKAVTPGLIDCHSHTAIDGPVNEGTHNVSAEVRIADVIDPFDVAIYRELAGGLTTIHPLHGSANAIGGQDDVLKLKWGEGPAALRVSDAVPGIKLALGENPKQSNWRSPKPRYPQTRMGVSALIRERFLAARDYRRRQRDLEAAKKRGESPIPVRTDLQLEAVAEILEGKRLIHAHGYVQQELLDLMRTCEEFGARVATFQHVLEGYKVADEIAAHGAGASAFSDWWAYKFEVYDAIPYNGALMRERGVLVSYNSDSDELARRLSLEAAKAVKYGGVPREEALKFVTANPARQLRLEKRIGSLEPGKDGDFAVWSGDPLSSGTVCLETWIEGKKYFDREADLNERAVLAAEKADLIAKARLHAARGAPSAPSERPGRPAAKGCLELEREEER